jgi:hypothetical protein
MLYVLTGCALLPRRRDEDDDLKKLGIVLCVSLTARRGCGSDEEALRCGRESLQACAWCALYSSCVTYKNAQSITRATSDQHVFLQLQALRQ